MRPQPCLDHVRQEGLGDEVGAGGVDGHDLVPDVERGLQERNWRGDARDVGERADRRQVARRDLGGDGRLRLRPRVLRRDVDGVAEGGHRELISDVGGDLGGLLAVEVEDDDGPALAGVALGDGHADAAIGGGAGDDGGASGGHVVHSLSDQFGDVVTAPWKWLQVAVRG